MMRVLGIDPATIVMGYGVVDSGPRYVDSGVLEVSKAVARSKRLIELGSDLRAVLAEYRPDALALETAKWGGFPAAAGALGEIRGIILWLAAESSVPVFDYTPGEARSGIGMSGAADKNAVGKFLTKVLRLKTQPQNDATDGLALALCHLIRQRE